jgi:hypothetical protein
VRKGVTVRAHERSVPPEGRPLAYIQAVCDRVGIIVTAYREEAYDPGSETHLRDDPSEFEILDEQGMMNSVDYSDEDYYALAKLLVGRTLRRLRRMGYRTRRLEDI